MNTQIIVAGLRARHARTAVGMLAVALEVVLILLLVGMANGSLADTANRVAGVGGEILVKNADSSFMLGVSPATLPFKIGEEIAKIDGVKAAAPVVAQMEQRCGCGRSSGGEPASLPARQCG